MNPIDRFEIDLEHDIDEQYQYQPGEDLCGNVVLELTAPIKVKAIQVQIKGESSVSWEEEGRSGGPVQYGADETYIDVTKNLLEAEGTDLITLGNGRHKFPLEYVLPDILPSSFIGKFGSITYVVKATLKEDKRFGLSTMITSEPFLVLRKLDISEEHRLLMKREERVEKRVHGGLCCCLSGKIITDLKVNKTGHLPGEDIFMDAEITNSSPRTVKTVQACIIMHSSFHARNKTRHNTQIVNKKRDEWEMSYGEGRRWKGVRLTIPPYIPESRLDGCDIIDIKYELAFKIEVSGGHEIKVVIPLTVGTSNGEQAHTSTSITGNKSWTQKMKIGEDEFGFPNGDNNNMNGGAVLDDGDVSVGIGDDEEASNFRYPMAPGDTRKNPLYDDQVTAGGPPPPEAQEDL